ncbi:signal-induced proliferation-associated 1-like protein 1 isoform X1 [Anguilla anguilla]|uniref:signal-induced proliferation-associated 1-like protein 1 isoform X1 n=2 Tax=Anguilla anguilla TaxID=7936 RepID=UPI0015B3084C|nr:signal-induced proliferation-associated 1-like protein 1 isoform X1 [Anguilla anguilla]XP_035276945.1 signal-induced proliferation-associated 1-like protein 1 isoform X1 [Anguilla anguilla]XP_035276954.1 signal-induced proliferation-associated 1-like protein 1 isoform X1 [Anguilla anguilla]
MTSLKRSQTERSVGGSVPATDEFYTRRLPNGGAPPPRSESAHLSGCTPGVPKMGVRARVADWPPRKDSGGAVWHVALDMDAPGPAPGSAPGNGQTNLSNRLGHLMSPQDSNMLRNIHNTLKSKTQAAAAAGHDGRFLSPDDQRGSSRRGPRRIRQRSNSDITISELDAGSDGAEDWGSPGAKWSPVHREYGSTSSIDKHGPSGESFFDMLKGYQGDKPDQRSPAPDRLGDLLTISHKQAGFDLPDGPVAGRRGSPSARLKEREKPLKRRSKSETGGDSIFRKLRTARTEGDSSRAGSDAEDGRSEDGGPPPKPWACQKGFAHYDVQSVLFDLNEAAHSRQTSAKLRNTTTGASAAAAASASSSLSSTHSAPYSSPCGSQEELSAKDGVGLDAGDDKSNELVLSCPCFRNEVGGEGERKISLSKLGSIGSGGPAAVAAAADGNPFESSLSTHCTNNGVAVLEVPKDSQGVHMDRGKRYIVEHVDLGSYYYRKYFYLREHWNYFGVDETLGPVAVSLRREKLEDHKDHGPQYNYRVIFRTSELTTLRGSILEDGVPSTSKHGTARGLPLKEVLEYLVPELNAHCLRLALNTPKVTEQLMKLDEQGLSFQLKVGVMYCQAGQSSEEEMYNNEAAGPAMEEFLQLLGERVRLKGFTKYRAQLDTKTDSTGTHSLYTTYKDYEIMFHVSTMLPYTPNNKQQLLRKRHIGNDIVTIVFQEPGAQPFTPKNIRSHFQHVFVIVRAHSPCSDSTCYSVAVARSRDVPSFGPPIPKGVTFPKSTVFRDFLLAKVINAENAAHKSDKFRAMATRTRQEYLRDLAERHVTSTPIDPSGKFPFISLAHKRKEKSRPYGGAELRSLGAVTWPVHVEDHGAGAELEGLLAVSNELLVLIDREAKAVVFNCSVRDVIGWTLGSPASMKIFYERGECVSLRSVNNNTEDFRDIVKRLELLTKGCETTEMTLRRNGLGQLGFHVNYEGIVAEVEPYGYAWQAGLRQGSRLVEICKVAVATLSHEQMIDLLRTSVTVRVVIIPPHEDSTPRRGCSELFRLPVVEYKGAADGVPFEYKFPFRSNNNKWQRSSASPQQSLSASPQGHGGGPGRAVSLGASVGKAPPSERAAAIPRSVSSDGRPLDNRRFSPGSDNYALASSVVMGRSAHNRNSPSMLSYSDVGPAGPAHWRQKSVPEGFGVNRNSPLPVDRQSAGEGGGSSSGKSTPNRPRAEEGGGAGGGPDRTPAEPQVAKPAVAQPSVPRIQRQEQVIHLSPNKNSQTETPYSSHSSSNTLSSNASSGAHSDEKWYEIGGGTGERPDSEVNGFGGGGGYLQGASADSGIDATSYGAAHGSSGSLPAAAGGAGPRDKAASPWHSPAERSPPAPDSSPVPPGSAEGPARSPPAYPLPRDGSSYSLSDAASHTSTLSSRHSGSPVVLGSSRNSPREESPSATSPTSQTSLSPGPKSFYPRQGATSKYLIGWRKPGSTINSVGFGETRKRHQSDGPEVRQPQLKATMRDLQSPQRLTKSTVEEDLKKLIALDSPPPTSKEHKPSFSGSAPGRRSLHRTLSDESIYSGQRDPSFRVEPALPSEALFTCSTVPRSPTVRGVALRRPPYALGAKLHGDLSASETSLSELQDRQRQPLQDPGLMPLPDTDADSGLDWCHLVDAAKAFEDQRASLLAAKDVNHRPESTDSNSQHAEPQATPQPRPSLGEVPAGLLGKVSQLESMVRLLQEDLQKEKEDKAVLQAQIQSLREDNQRLQEESQNASAKLKKFTEWVFNTIDMN